ncbi:MAG: hypothetical protein U1E21_15300 [Reyranellaceae bacterium]
MPPRHRPKRAACEPNTADLLDQADNKMAKMSPNGTGGGMQARATAATAPAFASASRTEPARFSWPADQLAALLAGRPTRLN